MNNFGFNTASAKRLLVTVPFRKPISRVRVRCLNDNLRSLSLVIGMFSIVLLAAGCAIPRAAALPTGTPAERKMAASRTLWLAEIQLTDPTVDAAQRESLQPAMTMALLNYLKESGVCTDANLLPGSPGNSDLELEFTVSKYRQYMLVHPALFPLSILTATIYIWVNGPIVSVHTEIQGSLTVKDSTGKFLATVTSQRHAKMGGGLWDQILNTERTNTGANTRLQFFDDLLVQACRQLGL